MLKNQKGISLVEMLITVALIAITMPLLAQIFISSLRDYVTGTKSIAQQDQINHFYSVIRRDFERCREVIIKKPATSTIVEEITFRYETDTYSKDGEPKNWHQLRFNKGSAISGAPAAVKAELELKKTYMLVDVEEKPEINQYDSLKVKDQTVDESSGFITLIEGVRYKEGVGGQERSVITYAQKKLRFRIYLQEVNTDFLRSRNYSEPVDLYLDITGKKVLENN